jgi:hypothetical protein
MAIPIAKKLKPMPLPETMGAPHFSGVEVTKLGAEYECLSSPTGTNLAAEDFLAILPLLLFGNILGYDHNIELRS